MTTLNPNDGHLVVINTFTVDPVRADELLQVLEDATERGMRKRSGFISANFHVSLDKKHIANYAQWRSKPDFDAMLREPAAQEHMKKAAEIAESFEAICYELWASHSTVGFFTKSWSAEA